MRNIAVPITLIVVGAIGVVWNFGWFPNAESVTALALAAAGILILVTDRITKQSIVLGPMLIAVGGSGYTTCIACAGGCSSRSC